MEWKFNFPSGPVVTIAISADVDTDLRLAWYREGRAVVPAIEQELAEIYAEATYLKYRSASDVFGVTVGSLPDLKKRFGRTKEETLILLEGIREDTDQHVGALLLRFAWTGDIVIDFVGTNLAATKHSVPPLQNSGTLLVYAALRLGEAVGAPLVYAETARHSQAWWDKLLAAGEKLVKVDDVPTAAARLKEIITTQGKVTIAEN